MNEYVGMQAIANAVGVTYNELWVAVRAATITLRIDTQRTNEPYVATDSEVRAIRARLKPECAQPRPQPQRTEFIEPPSENDPAMDALGKAIAMLEKRCEQKGIADQKHK